MGEEDERGERTVKDEVARGEETSEGEVGFDLTFPGRFLERLRGGSEEVRTL